MRKAILILFIQAMLVAGLVITGGTITSVAQGNRKSLHHAG